MQLSVTYVQAGANCTNCHVLCIVLLKDTVHNSTPTGILRRGVIGHRRGIKTDAKAKVVASVWGTEFIQFLAAPAILY